jgi:hypothetical protein
MALPKSMRILAVITAGIFFYLCLLIFQAPSTIEPPSTGQKMDKMIKDPNLDRVYINLPENSEDADLLCSHWRTPRTFT